MNRGLIFAAIAYGMWGLFPLYFRQIAAVPPFEIVVHRCVWALLLLLCILAVMRHWTWLWRALRRPRLVALFATSALTLSGNWLVYVWAVNNDRVVDASLGYFVNPLVNVLLGYVVLHERLRLLQLASIALAGVGVLWLAWQAGQFPWIALALAVSFAVYGLIRKTAALGPLEGLTLETFLLGPLSVPILAWWTFEGTSALVTSDLRTTAWLLLGGPLTIAPLILFAAGARRISMTTLGLLQYITPTMQLALGVWLYKEPFGAARVVGFGLIWLALAIYSVEAWWMSSLRGRADCPVCLD